MDYTGIIKAIQARYSKCYANKEFYDEKLKLWLSLYKGEEQNYHILRVSNGITHPERHMYRLNMAPRVARDWKSATLNEDIDIVVNSTNNKSSVFLQGTKGNGGVLGDNNFTVLLSSVIEKMYALGTSAIAIDLDSVNIDEQGNITATENSKIRLKQYNAMQIIPISWHNNIIDEVAFASTIKINDKEYTTLSVHKKENGTYVIYNTLLNKDFNEVTIDNINTAKIVKTNSEKPLFYIFKTNIDNNIDLDSPLGISVYADALDNLKGVDTIYDRSIYEIISGQRLVLMNKALLTTDEDGKCIVPQDERQYFMNFLGDDALADISEFVKDFTPDFRTDALDKELQNQLNMLSFKCGLGTQYYRMDNNGNVTATEFLGSRQDFVRNVGVMNKTIVSELKSLFSEILWVGQNLLGRNVNADAKIIVSAKDGLITSDKEEKESDRADVAAGLMSKLDYMMKWQGLTEEQAREKLNQMKEEQGKTEEIKEDIKDKTSEKKTEMDTVDDGNDKDNTNK